MADIGGLVVRLTMETGGARKELASISQGFKQLNSVMNIASTGANEFEPRINQLATINASWKNLQLA